MAASGTVAKGVPWRLVVGLQGRTTPAECRMIVDRLEEFAALLSSQWSEFRLVVAMTESVDPEARPVSKLLSKRSVQREEG